MTKNDLIKEISKNTGIETKQVEVIVEDLMKSIKDHLINKEVVHFRGFGNFKLKKRAKKPARNISKNTVVIIPEHFIPSFKPSKEFYKKLKKNEK
jgi:DNA-binding protein HU-beta